MPDEPPAPVVIRMRRLLFSALALGALAAIVGAWPRGATPAGRTAWTLIAPDMEFRRWWPRGAAAAVVAVRVPAHRIRIAAGEARRAAEWRRQEGALLAVNGGFFDPQGRPLGLRVRAGRIVTPLSPAEGGVFFVRDGRARIVHRRDFRWQQGIREAVQCGPRLVVNGQTLRLKPQAARRTGIGIRRDGRVVIAACDAYLPLAAWAALWAARDGLDCVDALNLDGGSSTQLSLRAGRRAVEIEGGVPVPDAVLVK